MAAVMAIDELAKVTGDVRPGTPEDAVQGVVPSCVVAPTTVVEASEVMRIAAGQGLRVVPRGAGTKLHWGNPPTACDLIVDTGRLDRVIDHAAGDLVVKAEAGLPLARLQEALAATGQQLATDSPLPSATVGGTLATGVNGPRRLLYGSVRDLLIGITVVRADGVVARSGGKVVKNVAGYDLGKLFTGSYGTLGLIVETAFRLHPLARARAYVAVAVADPVRAAEKVQAVLHSPLSPAAVEVDRPPGGPITVVVLLEGVPEGVSARTEQGRALLGPSAQVSDAAPDWWGLHPAGQTLVRLIAKPADLADVFSVIDGLDAPVPPVRGSAGSGVWHLTLPAGIPPEAAAAALARLRAAGHTVVVLTAPEDLRGHLDLWGPQPTVSLMRRVKDQFDPEHRLAPGRFAGGI